MNYRRVGNSGLVVSEIGLGSWLTLDDGDLETAELLHRTDYEAPNDNSGRGSPARMVVWSFIVAENRARRRLMYTK